MEDQGNQSNKRRLSDVEQREVFFIQLCDSTAFYEFCEYLHQVDEKAYLTRFHLICREYEMIGGESHSMIVFTYEQVLFQMSSEECPIQVYFPFPAISKVLSILINYLDNRSASE